MEDRQSLIRLIDTALDENRNLLVEFSSYPPFVNSLYMLEEIKNIVISNNDYLSVIRDEQKWDVGLLAVKALDFYVRFRYYADFLHKIWRFFKPLVPYSGVEKNAYDFYVSQGIPIVWIPDHLNGIDFTKKVEVVVLQKGVFVYQWNISGKYHGDYYAKEKNSKPSCLGINPLKANYQGTIFKRY